MTAEIKFLLDSLNVTMETKFVPWSESRSKGDDHRSLNWIVTIKRNGREILTTDYSAGIAHCPSYEQRVVGSRMTADQVSLIEHETETGFAANGLRFKKYGHIVSTKNKIEPSFVDVIYSLISDYSVLDYPTYEEWARDFGFDEDSRKGEALYRKGIEQALKVRNAFSPTEIEQLQAAYWDY